MEKERVALGVGVMPLERVEEGVKEGVKLPLTEGVRDRVGVMVPVWEGE